jgi:hypothetical protein
VSVRASTRGILAVYTKLLDSLMKDCKEKKSKERTTHKEYRRWKIQGGKINE